MKENFQEIKHQIRDIVLTNFLPVIKNRIEEQRKFISQISTQLISLEKLIKSEKDVNSKLAEIIESNSKIAKLLNEQFAKKEEKKIIDLFPNYHIAIEKFIRESEESVTEIQDEARFISGQDERLVFRILKPVKKISLNISNFPISFGNQIRKLFDKPSKEKRVWNRIVYIRKLRELYLKELLTYKLIDIQRQSYFKISSTQKELKQIYESLDRDSELNLLKTFIKKDEAENRVTSSELNELQTRLELFINDLPSKIDPIIDEIIIEYESAYAKAGTVEFPKYKLREGALKSAAAKQEKLLQKVESGWQNNLLALNDSFKLNNEIYLIKYKTQLELNTLVEQFKSKINEKILPASIKIFEFVDNTKNAVTASLSPVELQNTFRTLRSQIKNELTENLIPRITNILHEENISSLAVEFNRKLVSNLECIAGERVLVSTDEYDEELKESDISYISPKEILEFSAAPKIFESTFKLRETLNSEVQRIQNVYAEIDHVSDFTIDSAINLLKDDVQNIDESKTTAIEGLERALKKISQIDDTFDELSESFSDELSKATDNFHSELRELTQTDKLFDTKLTLARDKTLEKSKQLKRQAKKKLKYLIPHVIWLTRKYFRKLKAFYFKIRELVGLAPKAKIISSEVSDYLAETQAAIHELPFVYQRLFEIKPLEDKRFYFGRDLEMRELNKAFSNWQSEKFSPAVIVGEKGSGCTTLINFFVDNIPKDYEVIRHSVNVPCYKTQDFLKMLGNLLNNRSFQNNEDVVAFLNDENQMRVIVLENMQRLFLRKVNGFVNLRNLFEIISRTNKNVFWLTTSTLYCWQYLDKTLHAPDHMGYIIHLKKLNENQITELVSKRHRVSGYNVEYEVDDQTLKSKSFKNLQEKEKQPYLMKKYFVSLNKFAQSNISLALLFWLRSAKNVVDDKILMGSPPELDYSFLDNLSNEKILCFFK